MKRLVILVLFCVGFTAPACPEFEVLVVSRSVESALGPMEVPPDFTRVWAHTAKSKWTRAAIKAVAGRQDLDAESKVKLFEEYASEIAERSDELGRLFKIRHPDEAPPVPWRAHRYDFEFGTVFQGDGPHILLITKEGELYTIQRNEGGYLPPGWNPGFDPALRPRLQTAPVKVEP